MSGYLLPLILLLLLLLLLLDARVILGAPRAWKPGRKGQVTVVILWETWAAKAEWIRDSGILKLSRPSSGSYSIRSLSRRDSGSVLASNSGSELGGLPRSRSRLKSRPRHGSLCRRPRRDW